MTKFEIFSFKNITTIEKILIFSWLFIFIVASILHFLYKIFYVNNVSFQTNIIISVLCLIFFLASLIFMKKVEDEYRNRHPKLKNSVNIMILLLCITAVFSGIGIFIHSQFMSERGVSYAIFLLSTIFLIRSLFAYKTIIHNL